MLFLFFVPLLSLFSLFSLAQTLTSGMCDILFFLVQVLDTATTKSGHRILSTTESRDAMAFHCFVCLMQVHGVESCFAPGVHHVRTSTSHQSKYFSRGLHFSSLLNTHRPKLAEHLSKISIDIGTVVSPWFRTLLSNFVVLQTSTVLRIWDNFLIISASEGKAKGWDVIYRCLLVVFSMLEDQLMNLGLEGTMRLLWNIKSEREDVFNMDANKLFAMGNELFFEGDEEDDEEDGHDVVRASTLLDGNDNEHVMVQVAAFQRRKPPSGPPPPIGVQAKIGLLNH
jgi:hypothetical protein|tara:strand:+ start:957 stop:1805 length:849 start_codon:yes stop_codon:yes gene_type:complete